MESYWDKAYILSGGELKAELTSAEGDSLEELFFSVTGVEGK